MEQFGQGTYYHITTTRLRELVKEHYLTKWGQCWLRMGNHYCTMLNVDGEGVGEVAKQEIAFFQETDGKGFTMNPGILLSDMAHKGIVPPGNYLLLNDE